MNYEFLINNYVDIFYLFFMNNQFFIINYVNNKNSKTDVLFISNGVMTPISIESSMILSNSNINSKVLNVTTAKPIDTETVCNEVSSSKHVVIVEEHTLIGGLASACLENLTDNAVISKSGFIFLKSARINVESTPPLNATVILPVDTGIILDI